MSSAAEILVQIQQLKERLRIAQQGLATLNPNYQMNQAIIARYRDEVATLPTQISILEAQLKSIEPVASAGKIVRDDQAAEANQSSYVNPTPGIEYLDNGRIQPPPDTTASSNAVPSPPEIINDFGTDAELRPYIQTQSIPGERTEGPIKEDAFRTPIPGINGPVDVSGIAYQNVLPGGLPGIGAANDDSGRYNTGILSGVAQGQTNTVSALNSINFAEKIIAQPNVLDQYASYTYSASLYLMSKSGVARLLNTGSRDLSGAKLLLQSGGISQTTRSAYFDLDYYIDDMEIHSTIVGQGTRAAHNVTEVKMKIIEPNGISFVENLANACQEFVNSTSNASFDSFGNPVPAGSAAARVAGATATNTNKKLPYTSQPYLLVIRFYGYDAEGNLVKGGKKATTTDPNSFVEKFYPLVIEKLNFKVAGKAAEYDIKFKAPQYQLNGGQGRASLPFNFEFSGGTVNDILAGPATYGINQVEVAASARAAFAATDPRRLDLTNTQKGAPSKASAIIPNKNTVRQGLMAALNAFQQELKQSGKIQFADEFNVEFALPAMASASVVLPGVNKNTTSMNTGGTAADKKLGSKQSMDTKTQNIAATAGMQIVQFIDMVLRNSSYISDQQVLIVDSKTGKEKPGPGVNLKNTAWYKISFKAIPKMDEFDSIRNDYAYKFTYTISPYKITQLYSPYFKQPAFNGVHKSYKYWFTGQNTSVLSYEETLNNLYFIALTNQSQGTTANINELLKQQPYTASGQASQGNQGRGTEPGANAADQLYSAGDLKECNMSIVGDPAWLQQGEAFTLLNSKDPYYYQPFLSDGTINFDSQQILFEIAFNTPRDYNILNGLMEPSMAKNTEIYPSNSENLNGATKISRIYIATHCISNFKQGKFTQQLKGSLRVYKTPGTTQATVGTEAATLPTATAVAAQTQSKAIKAPGPRSTVTDPTPSSVTAKGTQALLSPVTQADNPSLSQLQASPVYIQARRNGATPAAALEAAQAAFAAGTNNGINAALPGIRTGNQLIVKEP